MKTKTGLKAGQGNTNSIVSNISTNITINIAINTGENGTAIAGGGG
jgi:hypothetical protein